MTKSVHTRDIREISTNLHAGDELFVTGEFYTMRDAGHERVLTYVLKHGKLPFNLKGKILFYAGPTPPKNNQPFGAIGPTTASRMDFATPALLKYGIAATIGKGMRSHEVVEACKKYQAPYFTSVGGVAAVLAKHVVASELIAYEDLGTEALRKLTVKDFPLFVGIDIFGKDIYTMARNSHCAR